MVELLWDGKYDGQGKRAVPLRLSLPFQTVETVNESSQERQKSLDLFAGGRDAEWRNRLVWGDKKYVLPALLDEFAGQVDLIYIDPPFATGDDFSYVAEIPSNGSGGAVFTKQPSLIEEKAYRDTWGVSAEERSRGVSQLDRYLRWFAEAASWLKQLLSERGSIYVHLDWRVVHYAKAILDEIFGMDNFKNEIIWRRARTHNDPGGFGRVHDSLLYYRLPGGTFNPVRVEYREEYVRTAYRHADPDGRHYQLLPLHSTHVYSARDDNKRRFGDKVLAPPPGKYWRWSQKKIDDALERGLIVLSKNDVPRYKKYLDEAEGAPPQSIWDDIKMLSRKDMVGYPTQKPDELLERLIKASSNEGDLVLDCFAGSGTTAVVAERLGRRWLAADLSRFAIHTTRKRLLSIPQVEPFVVQNLGKYERQLWQVAEFGNEAEARARAYRNFILNLYKSQPLEGYAWLHGLKQGRMVHVGTVDAPVTAGDVKQMATEFGKAIGKGKNSPKSKALDVLGWDFAFELNEVAKQQAAQAGIDLRFLRIPREVLDRRAVEQGDIRFFELAALAVNLKKKGRKATLTLTNFVIPLDDIPAEVQGAVKHWTQWIDYWAIDWDNKGDAFHNEWQSYRTTEAPELQIAAERDYDGPGTFTVVVKVIDILGNDTTTTMKLEVS